MNLILENVRTFVGLHEVPIKPLTILIGENSAGKSTLLACLAAVTSPLGYPLEPKFNEPPYNLGGFDSIISKELTASSLKYFSLGLTHTSPRGEPVTSVAKYLKKLGRIKLLEFDIRTPSTHAQLTLNQVDGTYNCICQFQGEEEPVVFAFDPARARKLPFMSAFAQEFITVQLQNRGGGDGSIDRIMQIGGFHSEIETQSIAPIRTKPERTYEPSSEHFNPEGTHIPFVLARALWDRKSSGEQKDVITALERFGQESGLFQKISVKNLGKRGSAPFQILVNMSGKNINLLDVGYGVSQSLPVIVESALAETGKLLLIQQPEVHLHPRAQAALGSFFVSLASNNQKRFVIETHSDYIVDRIRQEVAKADQMSFEDILILYFERQGLITRVYPLQLDALGNIVNAPPTYRDFFLREEINLLSRSSLDQ